MEGKQPKFIISGGGTGGHIFPALSIAKELKRQYPEGEFLFIGAEGRMEMECVPKEGFSILGLPVKGIDRKHIWKNAIVFYKFIKSLRIV
ncbi:MAG TPA: UDP-N-acetylglucosamine--N-acetylmuramyl-(pentapeptide) pyrophosphoryl-undecaprenol N-acetylglucosamine transferase, partial [Porphyromonadaceae bacterium]|nr:UDP-N-acetylglucosamine--N-acetylmuramyl-(pentapeptide) pyrophosphoryl-undecaprenol N-acetylglucosamine transferase [Porphyromonadaceae bacterium]